MANKNFMLQNLKGRRLVIPPLSAFFYPIVASQPTPQDFGWIK